MRRVVFTFLADELYSTAPTASTILSPEIRRRGIAVASRQAATEQAEASKIGPTGTATKASVSEMAASMSTVLKYPAMLPISAAISP